MPIIRLLAKKEEKIAFFLIPKVGSSSIPRTLFSSAAELAYWDEQIKKKSDGKKKSITGWDIVFGIFHPEGAQFMIDFNSPNMIGLIYRDKENKWEIYSYDEKTKNFQYHSITIEALQSYFTFTFVRNPYTRLVSFFQSKLYYNEEEKLYRSRPHYKRNNFALKGFSDLIEQIAMQESEIMDPHFRPQTCALNKFYRGGGKVDFMGKLENIEKDFEGLQEKHNLLPLERLNKSLNQNRNVPHGDWRDYYTPALAKLVYDRWRDDFTQLGYAMEYPKLLAHLGARVPLRWRKRQFFAKLGLPQYKKYLP